jgi:glutathionylspermidine synthase
VLWQLFGNDPARRDLLLPAYFRADLPASMTSYAVKPVWSREGANITLVRDGDVLVTTSGNYGDGEQIYQQLCELPSFDSPDGVCHPVLGVWMVDGEPAGMGIREGVGVDGLVTGNRSSFVPHTIGSFR